ncbi:ribosome biogenesis GTP-binding protein YihA/YsxC [Oscillospiraceae bacterium PP1C4]
MNYHNIQFETSFGTSSQLPPSDLPEIAFAGRSNVGKSSMINKLFNRKQLARVSAVPGKTATINFFRADDLRFSDLPGYGYAKVSKSEKKRWSELIEGYFAQDRNLQLVFQLIDMRHAPTSDDLMMIDFLIDHEQPFVVILTKKDKLTSRQQQERLAALQKELPCADQIMLIPFSSQTGEGVEDVKAIIAEIENNCAQNAAMDAAQEELASEIGYSDELDDITE